MTSASTPVTSMATPELALDRVLATLPYIMEDDSSHASSESEERDYGEELYRIATAMTGAASKPQSITVSRPSIKLSRYSTLGTIAKDNPILDPQSTRFDLGTWLQNTIRRADQEGIKVKRAGFTFKQLNVSGSGSALNLQKTVGAPLMAPFRIPEIIRSRHVPHRKILRDFNGFMTPGEMLIVLGRPGSGCSTFLKTIAGEVQGLEVDKDSTIHYNGIPRDVMMKEFKSEISYNQEVDKHFPHLTVGQTLEFAALARAPHQRLNGVSREEYARRLRDIMMAVFGLSHTVNTKVGDDFVRGVSGGERKRVSIAEMAISRSPIALWDNSTRGLDAATAFEFINALRTVSDLIGMCNAVAAYQASQAIYDLFDKAIVLYEGREIYFGPTSAAKQYFEDMGWFCHPRQTTGDFLTSVTNPQEREPRDGYEGKIPRTPDEFQRHWQTSPQYAALQQEIDKHEEEFPLGGQFVSQFHESHRAQQAKHVRPDSKYLISIPMQVKLNTRRAYQRLWNNKLPTITQVIGRAFMALIVGSIYYGSTNNTDVFFSRGSTLFYAVLLNALMAITEIGTLYSQRPIVEKQKSYAFYHPFSEAIASFIADLPVKFVAATLFNVVFYFLSGLRYDAKSFFIYFLFVWISMLTMSFIYRTIAASTKTISQAMALAGIATLSIVVYTGYTIPKTYMHPWFKWISYVNPIAYAFESILVNELHGVHFPCASLVPAYHNLSGDTFICPVRGAKVGQSFVSGDDYVEAAFGYHYSHLWRNLGIIIAFLIFFMFIYLGASELNSSTTSTADVLVFRRGHVPSRLKQDEKQRISNDEESNSADIPMTMEKEKTKDISVLPTQKDVFTWRNVVYDIEIKGQPRRLLDNVSGFVKPGTLTALMGVSGAGKTTLLDTLAQRTSVGVVTGDMFVNGKPLTSNFQRNTGYVQQQDLHLETSTVREALRFSATLRQPKSISKAEKYAYVEEVIKMLNMDEFAEAVVGVPGEGLNVEQRKLLTIGVELAAKPALLLFLDEPTSGLDSQSSWAIVTFLRRLADLGQAVLATIHQPSSILFQEFDRLLFLAKGGRTVYFGEVGENSRTLLNYFERNGSRHCGDEENPAEFMLEIIGAGASGKATQDWAEVWKSSEEYGHIQQEIDQLHDVHKQRPDEISKENAGEFAMPFASQLRCVTIRVFQQYWRTPSYILGKLKLGTMASLFIGFSFFQSDSSRQGLQNVLFSIFMLMAIFPTLVQQVVPRFVIQRSLYEVRERPSKAYSWPAFLIANMVAEIPYQVFLGCLVWCCYYFTVFGITGQSPERAGLILLYCIQFFIFASSFAHLLIAGLPDAQTAATISTLLFSICLTFNGVLQPPSSLPGFWIFMYRVSPLTYLVSGIAATGLHSRRVVCSSTELAVFNPPTNETCGQYMAKYLSTAPGYLINPDAVKSCEYCSLSSADQFLASSNIGWGERWWHYGILWVYVVFNMCMAIFLYWFWRARKVDKKRSGRGRGRKGGKKA